MGKVQKYDPVTGMKVESDGYPPLSESLREPLTGVVLASRGGTKLGLGAIAPRGGGDRPVSGGIRRIPRHF
jgi:hypothetical protein